MDEHIFSTEKGEIHYWTNEISASRKSLVLLPGLTADHHLFDKQVEAFEKDRAGDTKSFNRKWAVSEGLPIHWIPGEGYNSNTDQPEIINSLISVFLQFKRNK